MNEFLIDAQKKDVPFLVSLMSQIYCEFNLGALMISDVEDLVEFNKLRNNGLIKLIMLDGNCVGSIVMKKIDRQTVELRNWYLLPIARNSGLGKISLKYAIDWAINSQFVNVRLFTSSKFIKAVEIYYKLGFVEHDEPAPCSCDLSLIKEINLENGLY